MNDLTLPENSFGGALLPKKSFGGTYRYVPPREGRPHSHAWKRNLGPAVPGLEVVLDEAGPVEVHPTLRLPPNITSPDQMRRWTEWTGGDIVLVAKRGSKTLAVFYSQPAPMEAAERKAGRPVPAVLVVPSADANSPLHESLREALADPRWQFRTVDGLARSLGVPRHDVRSALSELGDEVRRPLARDASGRQLYTLASRRPSLRERYMQLRERLATW